MSDDLFDSFGITFDGPRPPSGHAHTDGLFQPQSNALLDLQNEEKWQRMVQDQLPIAYRNVLNSLYMSKLVDRMRKSGRFSLFCDRCGKSIDNPRKLFVDEQAGLIYGVECYSGIKQKQLNLTYHHSPDGRKVPASSDELQTYICPTMGREFQALPENVRHCGSIPRMCAACPGTAVKNKHRKCDFEKAVGHQ